MTWQAASTEFARECVDTELLEDMSVLTVAPRSVPTGASA